MLCKSASGPLHWVIADVDSKGDTATITFRDFILEGVKDAVQMRVINDYLILSTGRANELRFYYNKQDTKKFSYLGNYDWDDISRLLHFVKFDVGKISENEYVIYFIT